MAQRAGKKLGSFRSRARRVAKGLASGLSEQAACVAAGYSPSTAKGMGYQIAKRPLVQSMLTDAAEAVMRETQRDLRDVVRPYFQGLTARVVVKSGQTLEAVETSIPDHPTRMDAADRIVDLFGGRPREVEMPAPPVPGLVVNIYRDGPPKAGPKTIDVTDRTKIQPQGEGINPPLGVTIRRQEG